MAFLYWLQTKEAEGISPRLFLRLFLPSCGQIPRHGLPNGPIDKGVKALTVCVGMGLYNFFLPFRHGQIHPVQLLSDVLVYRFLLRF